MPLPIEIRDLLKRLYDEAEKAPDLQSNARTSLFGRQAKIRVQLNDPNEIIFSIKFRD